MRLNRSHQGITARRSLGSRLAWLFAVLTTTVAFLPGTALAADPPSSVSLAADPAPVSVPDPFQLTATTSSSIDDTGYQTYIVEEGGRQDWNPCGNGSSCSRTAHTRWSDNPNPQPRSFFAEVRNSAGHVAARSSQVTVEVRPFTWEVSLATSPTAITVPESTLFTATLDRSVSGTGYQIYVIDEDNPGATRECGNGSACYLSRYSSWTENANPMPKRARVEVRDDSGHVAGQSGSLEVPVKRYLFDVSLEFSKETTWEGFERDRALATSGISMWGTSHMLKVRRMDGTEICSSNSSDQCGGTVTVGGVYRASAEDDEGRIFGASPYYTLTADGPRLERIDDVDLALLASMFANAEDICTKLLVYPGTHSMQPPSSLSDEYRVCESSRTAGKTGIELLRAIAAGVTAYGALHFLQREAERPTPAPGTETAEDSEAPQPVPGPVLGDVQSVASALMARSSRLTQQQADRIARQCTWLGNHKGINSYRECRDKPIFASGSDVPEATNHDLTALARTPTWVELNYRPRSDNPSAEGWYSGDSRCASTGGTTGRSCDEYPFFSTQQGGGLASPSPSLRAIDATDNSRQGGSYGAFTTSCLGGQSGRAFLGVPIPPSAGIPTQRIC